MRTVKAIALELDVSANTASQLAGLSTELERTLSDAAREHRAQGHLEPLQVVVTLVALAPVSGREAPGQRAVKPLPKEELRDIDLVDEFPREQIDGLPLPAERGSMFEYAPALPADAGLVRPEPRTRRQRRVRLRGDHYFSQAPFPSASIPARRAGRAGWRRLVAASADRVRRFAARARTSWRDVAPGRRLRGALPTLQLREVILPCVAVVLVAAQTGGMQTGRPQIRDMQRLEPQPASVRSLGTTERLPTSSWTRTPAERPVSRLGTPRAAAARSATSVATPIPRRRNPARSQTPPSVSAKTGSLLVESEPSGGQVFLNQVPVGVTPLMLPTVQARTYAVRIDVQGYSHWSRGIYVIVGQRQRVSALLERER